MAHVHAKTLWTYVAALTVATGAQHTVSGTSPWPGMKRAAWSKLLGVKGAACGLGLLPANMCSSCVLPQPLVPNSKQLNILTPHPGGRGSGRLPAFRLRGARTSNLSAAVVPRGCRDLQSGTPIDSSLMHHTVVPHSVKQRCRKFYCTHSFSADKWW